MKISGYAISSSQFNRYTTVQHDDLFLVASPTDENHLFYENKNEKYWDMCNQMLQEISSKYKFRSMAWEDENAYSLSNHNHDDIYNNTQITPILANGTQVATFVRDYSNEVNVYYPQIITYKYDEPYIGELKFVTDKQQRTVDINSNDFDGWVYPDGSEYDESLFPLAAEEFGSNDSKFNVPQLSWFFCGSDEKNKNVEATEVLRLHYHLTKLNLEQKEITGIIELSGTRDFHKNEGGGHNATDDNKGPYIETVKMKIDSISFNGNNESGSCNNGDGVITPTYNYIPVMIYIGKKNRG